ncbi:hypothetical protein [Frigidibacter sp. MR17.24]|uniref:hypothetical protein n=1 Tax=Frigidibacter sp. MR17.24 TaxID=3127345 RepID=UPI003012AB0E
MMSSTVSRPLSLERLLPGAVVLLNLLPLLLTPALPSIDFYAHIVRYNVLAHPDAFATHYQPHWALLPNLGMDVLGTALMLALPPLVGAKVLAAIVITAPVLGCMALSRALNGRVEPIAALLAGLLGYNLILFWGFANFLLGFGIALGSLGWWISRADRPRLQLAVMVPVGILVLFIHGLVFALWGLLLGAAELGLALQAGRLRPLDLARRAGRLLLLAVIPVLLFTQMQTAEGEGGATGALQNLAGIAAEGGGSGLVLRLVEELLKRVDSVLRVVETSLGPWPDRAFGLVLWGLLGAALVRGRIGVDRRIWPAAALCFVLIGLMPPNLFGVGHLDERMPLLFLAVLVAGLSPRPVAGRGAERGAGTDRPLMALFPLHLLLVVWALAQAGTVYRDFLAQSGKIDTGAMAAAAFPGETRARDASRACKPLLYLLQLRNGTAVPTFANPTQQPLRLAGPLATAAGAQAAPGAPLATQLPALLGAGFDSVVACDPDTAPVPDGTRVAASGAGWALYQNASKP